MKLCEYNNLTILALMKSCMDLDKVLVVTHTIEEVFNFKKFIAPYIKEGKGDCWDIVEGANSDVIVETIIGL